MASPKGRKSVNDPVKKRKRAASEADATSTRRAKLQKAEAGNSDHDGKSTALVKTSASHTRPMYQVVESKEPISNSQWKISKPMGGRMLDIDAILTQDEQYLIIAYNTSIQVYTAADSLLVRRIPITSKDSSDSAKTSKTPVIVSMRLSKKSSEFVWVATSKGRVYLVNWTKTDEMKSFKTTSATAHALSSLLIGDDKAQEEVLLVAESDKSDHLDLVAYHDVTGKFKFKNKSLLSLSQAGSALQLLEASEDGHHLAGGLNDRLFIGSLAENVCTFDELRYEFYSFDTPDIITSISLKVASKRTTKHGKNINQKQSVDVAVGGARGAIYVYRDAMSRLQASSSAKADEETIEAQKYHWHRRAVHAVKWSQDGNYLISGGSENVLVMWQLDTGKRNYLPHLSGSIENIVISPSGSSYVIHLDDNSTMIISTAELQPTAYISGLQSATTSLSNQKDFLVNRVEKPAGRQRRPLPAAIRPNEPSKLHLCVGNGVQSTLTGDHSAPYLQSFDLETFTSVTKQPLARTQATGFNTNSKGYSIDEPMVSHVAFSSDGKWLASVDNWKPSERDIEGNPETVKDHLGQERLEVHLKFWEMGAEDEPTALVSRVNAPHFGGQPEPVLDLAASPVSAAFATIGGDGTVRIWRPRVRKVDGLVAKGSDGRDLYSWSCSQAIPLSDGSGAQAAVDLVIPADIPPQGRLAFSEDGSTIFAAFGAVDMGTVYVINAWSGEVTDILEDLWTGQLHSIKTLSPFLIVLSDELQVYSLVHDDLRYGFNIPTDPKWSELMQLEVDRKSRTFALVWPATKSHVSNISIHNPGVLQPLMVRSIPHRVISLVAAPDTSGFLAIDNSAQVWTVAEESNASSLTAFQPLEDLRLETIADNSSRIKGGVGALLDEDVDMESDDEKEVDEPMVDEVDDMDLDDDTHVSIVAPQRLAEIFDAAPAFAGPSVEDMFYKVTSLLSAKPLSATAE